jgi:hypothetical protein
MVVVVADSFRVMITGGFTLEIVVDVSELAAAWFLSWQHFFAAFLEVVVSIVTKNSNW